jgi:serine/threonine-protein kinase
VKVCPACGTEYGDEAAFCARDRSPLSTKGGGLVGQLLGERYQIEAKLGQGAMGEVYRARHVLMGRICAIKLMNPSLSQDTDAIGRFNREATNASKITHPNVCAVYDFGFTPDGLLYLAMEYIEGRTLSVLMNDGPLPERRAVEILTQCAAGLEAAHELGIVHRDLKPDNIMVVDQRGKDVVKVVDFGIAKAAGGGDQGVTKTGSVVGTPAYMSPEQLTGDPVTPASDQYALALIFYRMLTGILPFAAATIQEAMARRLTERAPRLPGFPEPMAAAVARALERKPGDRFPSVTAFAEAIGTARTAPDRSLPRTEIVREQPRRWRTAMIAGSGLAVAAMAYGVWRLVGPGAPRQAALASPPAAGPPPAPLPATPSTPDSAVTPPEAPPAATTRVPTIADFETPNSPRARRAAAVAARLAEDPGVTDTVRAEMLWFVGQHQLDLGHRLEAARAFRRSCRLQEAPRCALMLKQFESQP